MDDSIKNIWFLPSENSVKDFNSLAVKDIGILSLNRNELIFRGKVYKVIIRKINAVSCGKQGKDFVNDWVKVEFQTSSGKNETVFFADGKMAGWSGIFGGTESLYFKIKETFQFEFQQKSESVQLSSTEVEFKGNEMKEKMKDNIIERYDISSINQQAEQVYDSQTMEKELNSMFTIDGLNRIQSVIKYNRIWKSVISLTVWGVVNFAWFYFAGNKDVDHYFAFPNTSFFQFHGVLILGILMLFFAVLGFIMRTSATIFLYGISLISVGITWWNYLMFAEFGVMMYKEIQFLYAILMIPGMILVIWGVKNLLQFFRILKWSRIYLSRSEVKEVNSSLEKFMNLFQNEKDGIVKTIDPYPISAFGFNISDAIIYTGKLHIDYTLMISGKLDNCFIINRKQMSNATFDEHGCVKIKGLRKFEASPISILLFKQWCGIQLKGTDIMLLVNEPINVFSTLKPFLNSEDNQLRDAAASVLIKVPKEDVISLLYDPITMATAIAIDACRQMNILTVHNKILDFITETNTPVRIAAIRYLSEFNSDNRED